MYCLLTFVKVNVMKCMPACGQVENYLMKLAKMACFPDLQTNPIEFKVEVCHFRHKSFSFLPFQSNSQLRDLASSHGPDASASYEVPKDAGRLPEIPSRRFVRPEPMEPLCRVDKQKVGYVRRGAIHQGQFQRR